MAEPSFVSQVRKEIESILNLHQRDVGGDDAEWHVVAALGKADILAFNIRSVGCVVAGDANILVAISQLMTHLESLVDVAFKVNKRAVEEQIDVVLGVGIGVEAEAEKKVELVGIGVDLLLKQLEKFDKLELGDWDVILYTPAK